MYKTDTIKYKTKTNFFNGVWTYNHANKKTHIQERMIKLRILNTRLTL